MALSDTKRIGLSNLLSHIRSDHAEMVLNVKESDLQGPEALTTNQIVTNKALRMYAWIETVVLSLQNFSFYENDVIRRHMQFGKVSKQTLLKYGAIFTAGVEIQWQNSFRKVLPSSRIDGHMVKLNMSVYFFFF